MNDFIIRRATAADVSIIARHRAEMFADMGTLPAELYQPLVARTVAYLETAIPAGEYVAWLAAPYCAPDQIVAGAGVQRRRVLPHPLEGEEGIRLASGQQGIVLNVFTEVEWRRRGLAKLLMEQVLAWARTAGLETLVLHASEKGRSLYAQLGFAETNEMRYGGSLTQTR